MSQTLHVEESYVHGGPGSVRPAERISPVCAADNDRKLTTTEQAAHNIRVVGIHLALHRLSLPSISVVCSSVNRTQFGLCESGKLNERFEAQERYAGAPAASAGAVWDLRSL